MTMKLSTLCSLAVALACAAGAAFAADAPAPKYRLGPKVVLGGDGGWDYLLVDAAARRLYITRGDRVQVVDADTLKPVGEIPGTPGVHGVALAPDLGKGFASAGKSDQVVIFDTATLKTLGVVATGKNPDAILYEPSTQRVFAFNGKSSGATVIDAAAGTVLGSVYVGGKPEFAATDGAGTVYVNIENTAELLVIDAAAMKVKSRWPLKPCEEPTGLAMDVAGKRLFAACANKMMAVVDATTGELIATPAIGEGPDAAAYDAETGLAFSSNREGTLTVIRRGEDGKYAPVQTVKTRKGARTMALDAKTGRVFLVTADFGATPKATDDNPKPRPAIKPGTFTLLTVDR